MEYYFLIKSNEALTHDTALMNPRDIMLGKKKSVTKDHIMYDMKCLE